MAADSRWLRLNVDWDDSEWVNDLEPLGQLAWIKLMCHVKRDGHAGRVRALSTIVASRKWNIPKGAIEEMLSLAEACGALAIEGEAWVLLNWNKYQGDSTNSERQKRYREKTSGESNADNALREVCNAITVRATETETETETETLGGEPPKPPAPSGPVKGPSIFDFLPSSYKTPDLEVAFAEYEVHRRQKKISPYTEVGLRNLANQFIANGLDPPAILAVVRETLARNWNGIPPKYIQSQARRQPQNMHEIKNNFERGMNAISQPTGQIVQYGT